MDFLVLGCGNPFRGDDGFGPAVINFLERKYRIPDSVVLIDAGLGCTDFLLDVITDDNKPAQVVVIDAIELGNAIGKIVVMDAKEFEMGEMPISRHSFPDPRVVNAIISLGVKMTFMASSIDAINTGLEDTLTPPLAAAVIECADMLASIAGLSRK